MPTPEQYIVAARALVASGDPAMDGMWQRGAALLARVALESVVRDLWEGRARASRVGFDVQMLCLHHRDVELARRASYTWSALSEACHHSRHSLPPTQEELIDWLGSVEAVLERSHALRVRPR